MFVSATRFFEWDFEREEYNYFPIPDTFVGKIYEKNAELIEPPKSSSMLAYKLLFGVRWNFFDGDKDYSLRML